MRGPGTTLSCSPPPTQASSRWRDLHFGSFGSTHCLVTSHDFADLYQASGGGKENGIPWELGFSLSRCSCWRWWIAHNSPFWFPAAILSLTSCDACFMLTEGSVCKVPTVDSAWVFLFVCVASALCTGFLQLGQAGATPRRAQASHWGGFCCGAQACGLSSCGLGT